MSIVFISGMPSKAYPFPGTTKKVHNLTLGLFSTLTLHLLKYVLLYLFSWMFPSFVAASWSFVVLGIDFLNV